MTDPKGTATSWSFEDLEMITTAVVTAGERMFETSERSNFQGAKTLYAWKAAKYIALGDRLSSDLRNLLDTTKKTEETE